MFPNVQKLLLYTEYLSLLYYSWRKHLIQKPQLFIFMSLLLGLFIAASGNERRGCWWHLYYFSVFCVLGLQPSMALMSLMMFGFVFFSIVPMVLLKKSIIKFSFGWWTRSISPARAILLLLFTYPKEVSQLLFFCELYSLSYEMVRFFMQSEGNQLSFR